MVEVEMRVTDFELKFKMLVKLEKSLNGYKNYFDKSVIDGYY